MDDVIDVPLPIEGRVHDHPVVQRVWIRQQRQEIGRRHAAIPAGAAQLIGKAGLDLDAVDHGGRRRRPWPPGLPVPALGSSIDSAGSSLPR